MVLAVFLASLSKDTIGKVLCAWFPIFTFVAGGYEHVIASQFVAISGERCRWCPVCSLLIILLIRSLPRCYRRFLIPEGMMNGSPVTVGRYIGTALVSSFIGNLIGAWIVALPLLYLYGDDAFDPEALSRGSSQATLPELRAQDKAQNYVRDIERAEP